MKNNFVFFPKFKETFVKCCRYSKNLDQNIAKFALSKEECEKVISLWSDENCHQARTGKDEDNSQPDFSVRKSKINWIGYSTETDWLYQRMFQVVNDANEARFKFDLNGFFEDFQLTKYESDNSHYSWHEDNGSAAFSVRKLSLVIQLSDPESYEGGDFEIFGEPLADKSQGTILIFPSYVLHRVKPVTKGTRYSLVSWISGPPFR